MNAQRDRFIADLIAAGCWRDEAECYADTYPPKEWASILRWARTQLDEFDESWGDAPRHGFDY